MYKMDFLTKRLKLQMGVVNPIFDLYPPNLVRILLVVKILRFLSCFLNGFEFNEISVECSVPTFKHPCQNGPTIHFKSSIK